MVRKGVNFRYESGSKRTTVNPDLVLFNNQKAQTEFTRDWITANPSHFYSITSTDTAANFQPMGGGPGYTDIVLSGDHVVSTKQQLIDAFDNVQSGETIYINGGADIDMTGTQITCSVENIQLRSNRGYGNSLGGRIKSDTLYESVTPFIDDHIIMLTGTGSRVSGVRWRGGNSELTDSSDDTCNLLRLGVENIEVDNCQFSRGGKWALEVYKNADHLIHHNMFDQSPQGGFGYNIWVRIPEPDRVLDEDEITDIYGNLFFYGRHEVAAAGSDNSSYRARNNMIVEHDIDGQKFDRHGGGTGHTGSKTDIYNNIINNGSLGYDFDGPGNALGTDSYLKFHDNWTSETTLHAAASQTASLRTFIYNIMDDTSGNTFSGSGWAESYVPTITVTANTTAGTSPLTVVFTATGVDPSGVAPVASYIWEFDNARTRELTFSNTYSKTFTSVGLHSVMVRPRNIFGVTGRERTIIIDVKASASQPALYDNMVDWWDFAGASETIKRTGNFRGHLFNESGTGFTYNDSTGPDGTAAINFDGNGQLYIEAGETMENFQTTDQNWTAAVWIKRDDVVAYANIVGILGDSDNLIYEALWQYPENFSTNAPLTLDTWVFMIYELDRFTARTIYKNNVLTASGSIAASKQDNSQWRHVSTFALARKHSVDRFSGEMAKFALWRRLLTADEKTWLYNGGVGRTFDDIV